MGAQTLYNDLTVTGDLTVSGTTTTINTTDLIVEDKNIIIGNVTTPSDTTGNGGGLTLKAASDKTLNWVSGSNRWTSNVGVEATALVRTGGTNAEFLKADGSVDSTAYAPIIAPLDSTITGSGKTFSNSDSGKIFHVTGTNTLTLPTYTSTNSGWTVGIVNVGGSTLTFNIASGSGNTINDVTTFSNTVKWSSLYIYKSDISGKFIAIGILY